MFPFAPPNILQQMPAVPLKTTALSQGVRLDPISGLKIIARKVKSIHQSIPN